jgi:CheY-like chemotaxis protein
MLAKLLQNLGTNGHAAGVLSEPNAVASVAGGLAAIFRCNMNSRPEIETDHPGAVFPLLAKTPASGSQASPSRKRHRRTAPRRSFATTAAPRPTVLLVDDDHDSIDMMRMLLEEHGYAVEAAYNGREALAFFEGGGQASLVVLDQLMPVMTGMEFLVERARRPVIARVPVIIVTATDLHQGMAELVVLRKPIDSDALIREIDVLCS